MRREWHIAIGILVFVIYQIIIEGINPTGNFPWLFGGLAAVVGSVLPDRIESGGGRFHRGWFHSWGMVSFITLIYIVTAVIVFFSPPFSTLIYVYLISCCLLGYVFHLLADSLTRMGLPR